ncbi:hypothetical protein LOTGIDRAFT_102754 [Lottia gigantea]|uniref:Uncharacterized protein n=1 Tax=Lottia gigantea TaxID=225164 RepID=V4CSW6_LOTGI|nr:hypothetical protein LOTGIDRAFT_102754 [Lottia gigantea]ESP05655.1 hypothetical protein LOTGIDRAFT_102754 [Lottia gigantea]
MELIPRPTAKRAQNELDKDGSKWYCRTCNLQCENHNIFLNHLTTENHRQRKHFSQNFQSSERQNLSEKFVDGFIEILSKFKRKRVPARMVFKAYNLQSNSISLENTQWKTIPEFLYWLKCCKKCQVNETFELIQEFDKETPKIDTIERQKKFTKVKSHSLCPYVRKMLKLDKNKKRNTVTSEKRKLSRDPNEKINFTLSKCSRKSKETPPISEEHIGKEMNKCINSFSSFSDLKIKENSPKSTKRKRNALEDIKMELESERDHLNRTLSWVTLGLQVRISSNFAGKQNIGKFGTVVYCSISEDNYLILLTDSNETVSVRQQDLQTVIPNLGSPVRIVNGGYRGLNAILDSVNKTYLASVHITNGLLSGRVLNNVHLNDICAFTDVTFK